MKTKLPEIRDFSPELTAMNQIFKEATDILTEHGCFVEVEFEGLQWKQITAGWRICCDDQHVLECRVSERIRLVSKVPGLMKSAEAAMLKHVQDPLAMQVEKLVDAMDKALTLR